MNLKKGLPVVVLTILVIAIVLIGELVVYTSDGSEFSSDAQYETNIHYTVRSQGAKTYSVLAFDNDGFDISDNCYIYYDEGLPGNYVDPVVPVGARKLDQGYYVEQLVRSLSMRGVDAEVIDSVRMGEIMNSGLMGNNDSIIVISGALPRNVYDGTVLTAVEWIEAGGRLYWLGNVIGDYFADKDGIHTVDNGVCNFLGTDCINRTEDKDFAYEEYDLCEKLCMTNDRVRYAVAPEQLPSGTVHIDVAFNDGTYSSTCLIGKGEGMICIIGGDYSNNQRNDLAQVVASGICHKSSLVGESYGTVHGTIEGTIFVTAEPDVSYIFLGGYYPVYGKSHSL